LKVSHRTTVLDAPRLGQDRQRNWSPKPGSPSHAFDDRDTPRRSTGFDALARLEAITIGQTSGMSVALLAQMALSASVN
jgi:hypothetical protein